MGIFALCLYEVPKSLLKDKPVARIAGGVISVVGYIIGCVVLYVVPKGKTWPNQWARGIFTVAGWLGGLPVRVQ
jgi:hypothetical protein